MSGAAESFEEFVRRRTIKLSDLTDKADTQTSKILETDKEFWDEVNDYQHLPYTTNELKRMNLETDSNSLHAIFDTWYGICSQENTKMGIMTMNEALWMRNCFTKLNTALKNITIRDTEAEKVRKENLSFLQKNVPDFKKIPL